MNRKNAEGILSDTSGSISEEESIQSEIDEDIELVKLIKERENQVEIEIDIDDL